MKQAILTQIKAYSEISCNKCGITIIQLSNKLKTPINELRPYLEELRKEGFIKVREGVNNNLIFACIIKNNV